MFCAYCGSFAQDGTRFCSVCGRALTPAVPAAQAQPAAGATQPAFRAQQAAGAAQPAFRAQPAQNVPANVVRKKIAGKRTIPTNRAFTHEELLRFLQERWDVMQYNYFVTDPSLKRYTDLYVVLPGTPRNMIIVYSSEPGLFSRSNSVSVSYIKSPAGSWEMMLRSIPTHNAFFGAAKIASTMSEKAEREGPTDEVVQRYADYLHYLLGQAGYLA